MKFRFVVVGLLALLAVVGFTLISPGRARTQTGDGCVHQPTIASLKTCVKHAAAQGFINSKEVTHRLLVKLDAAEEAVNDDYTSQAIHLLKAFIHEVKAQSGKSIVAMHAEHLVMHAQMVIHALEKESA
jgi:predicted negative regulator of RcsB-dependent stress response